MIGATALSLIGLVNIFGSSLFGWLGDRYRKKYLLSAIYFGCAIVIGLFILVPVTDFTALLFGGLISFLWLATVPLTSGTIAQIFGSRYLSTLYGIVFFSHQIGSLLGVWLAGWLWRLLCCICRLQIDRLRQIRARGWTVGIERGLSDCEISVGPFLYISLYHVPFATPRENERRGNRPPASTCLKR